MFETVALYININLRNISEYSSTANGACKVMYYINGYFHFLFVLHFKIQVSNHEGQSGKQLMDLCESSMSSLSTLEVTIHSQSIVVVSGNSTSTLPISDKTTDRMLTLSVGSLPGMLNTPT